MKNGISSPSVNKRKVLLYIVSALVHKAGVTVCVEARQRKRIEDIVNVSIISK